MSSNGKQLGRYTGDGNLELISLLRFEEPRAYISEHLPRMDELQDAPTRL